MDAEFRAITPQQINELGTYEIEESCDPAK